MLDHIVRFTAPAAYAVLPPVMDSPAATAFVLACGLQESEFRARRQRGKGPARGFWQFEKGGAVTGVLTHHSTKHHAEAAIRALQYPASSVSVPACYILLEHHDTLAFAFARLLIWTLPDALPARGEHDEAWRQYLDAWRAGKPHRATWNYFYDQAWGMVDAE